MFKGITRAVSRAAKAVTSTAQKALAPQPQHEQARGNAAAQSDMSCDAGGIVFTGGFGGFGGKGGAITGGGGGSGKQIGLDGDEQITIDDGVYRPCVDDTPDVIYA
ncbi:MAG: hypothetical protein R3F61_03730 [Myxococcota bacterium]